MLVGRGAKLARDGFLFRQVVATLLHQPADAVQPLAELPHGFPYVAADGAEGLLQLRSGRGTAATETLELPAQPAELRAHLRQRPRELSLFAQLVLDRARQQRLHALRHGRTRTRVLRHRCILPGSSAEVRASPPRVSLGSKGPRPMGAGAPSAGSRRRGLRGSWL